MYINLVKNLLQLSEYGKEYYYKIFKPNWDFLVYFGSIFIKRNVFWFTLIRLFA